MDDVSYYVEKYHYAYNNSKLPNVTLQIYNAFTHFRLNLTILNKTLNDLREYQ